MNTISSMKVPGLTEDKCVTLIGMAGAGKSTVGRAVAERLGWAYVDTDHLIESTYGARLQDVTDALDKERFLDVEARVIQSLRMQRAVLATGGSVVYRPEAMRYLTSLGPVVFLDVPLPLILERISRKPDRGLAIAPGQTVEDLFREREALYRQWATCRVAAGDIDVSETANAVFDAIAGCGQAMSERACGVRLHPAARLLRWMGRHAVGVCFLLIGVWLFRAVLAGADGISYDWQWYRVWRYLGRWTDGHFIPGPLLDGLGMTVRIALFGLALAVAAGLGAALLRLSPWPVARGMAHVYVGCLRNTPLLLQLFFVYFLFAPAIGVGPFGAAVLALGLFEGAYMAELFRAGLQSVPRAQWEAGISLGLGVWNTLRLVILPQAVRRMLPPLTSQLVSLIKDTSLVSAIAVADLTMQAQVLIADTFLAFEIWLIVAALYLALTLCVALPARWMERRYAWR